MFDTLIVFLKEFFENANFEKSQQKKSTNNNKNMKKYQMENIKGFGIFTNFFIWVCTVGIIGLFIGKLDCVPNLISFIITLGRDLLF